jgi:NAD(P)H-hydrate epimerase
MRFLTGSGLEVPAVTREQMRAIDARATNGDGPSLLQMMENAGRSLATLALRELAGPSRDRLVVVLAGGGGNGGGGICAARHVVNHGASVILAVSAEHGQNPTNSAQHTLYRSAGGREVDPTGLAHLTPDLIVDALIGYGLRHTPSPRVSELIQWANEARAPVLALDLPSGIHATTGAAMGATIVARTTLTLALPKRGLIAAEAGDLWLADLGIPRSVFTAIGLSYSSPFARVGDTPGPPV